MTQRILVAGATGATGRRLVEKLTGAGAAPVALVREGSDNGDLPEGTATRRGDLTDLPSDICDGIDVVIFAAGSGSGTSSEMTDKVDRDGAERLVDLAKKAGVSRFVMLSSFGADTPEKGGDLAHYLEAKQEADRHLAQSGLAYAILRPVALTDDGESGEVVLGEAVTADGQATRGDVAMLLAEAALTGAFDGQALDMQSA